jgi:hypothetical protein
MLVTLISPSLCLLLNYSAADVLEKTGGQLTITFIRSAHNPEYYGEG